LPHNVITPIVVSLGTTPELDLAEFRSGVGRIAEDVEEIMRLVRRSMPPEQADRVLLPVVVVYADEQEV
jgi:hypothetical protein